MEPNQGMSQEEARSSVIEFLQMMANMKSQAGQHKPIIKAIEELGVNVHTRDVQVNGVNQKCLVVVWSELVEKEYKAMTGYDPNGYAPVDNSPVVTPEPIQQQPVQQPGQQPFVIDYNNASIGG